MPQLPEGSDEAAVARLLNSPAPMSGTTNDLSYIRNFANRSPTLTREQELALVRRFRESGDRRAADTLMRAHFRLVLVLVMKYRNYGIPADELAAEGNCGLVTALSKFDPERGVRFTTYAKHWVRASILEYVIRATNVVGDRGGQVRPRLFFRLRRERARIAALMGDGIAAEEALAERLNVSPERVRQLLGRLETRGESLDAPRGRGGHRPLSETLASDDNPEDRYYDHQRHHLVTCAVSLALEGLDPRERYVVEHRLMAAPTDELSLADIGRRLGISRERARQLEERAKQKLGRSPAIHRNSHLQEWFAESTPAGHTA